MTIKRAIALGILKRQQERHGGKIVGNKLYPIAPVLTELAPLVPEAEFQRQWFVVQTEPNREKTVQEELGANKIDCYYPVEPHRQTRRSVFGKPRHVVTMRSMLPGYLFAGFDPKREQWEPINTYRGVRRILMLEMRPVPIPERVIGYLRDKELQLRGIKKKYPTIMLSLDSMVRILEPLAFAGLFGFVTAIDQSKYTVAVEIDLFGRKVPLELRPDKLEPM